MSNDPDFEQRFAEAQQRNHEARMRLDTLYRLEHEDTDSLYRLAPWEF